LFQHGKLISKIAMTTGSVDILKSNCSEYARASKGIAVLKLANGKNRYTEIAKLVGIHPTKTSSLLKKAEKLGLAQKIKAGIYKKVPGILGYMPPKRKIEAGSSKNIKDSGLASSKVSLKPSVEALSLPN